MIVAVYRKNTPNQGDLASTPAAYFMPAAGINRIDILDCNHDNQLASQLLEKSAAILLGGGGLLDHKKFANQVQYILDKFGDKVIIWGAGSNSVAKESVSSVSIDLSLARLVGVRDFPTTTGFSWVPCVSCMNPEIDQFLSRRHRTNRRHIGILENNSGAQVATVEDCGLTDIARFGNKKVSTSEILNFIASCRLLVTSSYHAAFWATLLEVPVLAVPTSSKFYSFKHRVCLVKKDQWIEHMDNALTHPGALVDCREANRDFWVKVKSEFPVFHKIKLNSDSTPNFWGRMLNLF